MSSTEPIHVEQPTTMNSPIMTNTINTSPPTTPTVPMSNVEMPGYMKRTFDLGEAVMGVIRVDDDGILSFSSSHSQAAMVSVDCALIHELKITRRHKKGIPRNTKGIRIKYSNDDVIIALNDDQVPILMRKIEQYRALPPYVKETLRLLRDEVIHDRKDKDKTVREANEMKETFDATINSLKDALHDSEEKLRSKDEEIAQLKIMINQYSKDLAEKNNQLQKERQLFDQYKNSTTETIALLESTVNRLQIEAIGDSSSYHIPTQSYGSLSRSEEKSVAPSSSSSSSSTFTSASYHPMNIDQRTDIVESPTIVTDRPPLPQTSTFTSSPIPQPPVDLKPTASPIEYISTGYANLPTSENYSSTSHPQSTNPASLGTTLHSPQQPQQVELQAKDPEQREEEHYRSENISEDKQDEPEFEEGKEFDFRHLMKKFTKPKPATDESEGGGVEEKKIIGAGRRVMFF